MVEKTDSFEQSLFYGFNSGTTKLVYMTTKQNCTLEQLLNIKNKVSELMYISSGWHNCIEDNYQD